jgi:hypothetical protein
LHPDVAIYCSESAQLRGDLVVALRKIAKLEVTGAIGFSDPLFFWTLECENDPRQASTCLVVDRSRELARLLRQERVDDEKRQKKPARSRMKSANYRQD